MGSKAVERRALDVGHEETNSAQRTMAFSLWLSWRELNGRKVVFLINVILVALFIALPVSLDFVGNARKNSIGTRIDYMGPSLILAPKGVISSDLVTAQLKGSSFSASALDRVRQDFLPYLRSVEARLIERIRIEGRELSVMGIDFENVYSYPFKEYSIKSDEVLLGTIAAEKLGKERGDSLKVAAERFTVAGVIATTGSIEDASVFFPLEALQGITDKEGRINEIRLFPESVSSYEKLKPLLQKYSGELNIIDAYRGDTAEKGVDSTLLNYQKALYTAGFILIAFCIMISTYINLDARKAEVSTVSTLGAAQGVIFQVLILRTIWITLLGSAAGHIIAIVIASLQSDNVPLRLIWSTSSFIQVTSATIGLGVLVTIPFALYSVYKRDTIKDL